MGFISFLYWFSYVVLSFLSVELRHVREKKTEQNYILKLTHAVLSHTP